MSHFLFTQVTALHLAAQFSSARVLKALREAGAEVNAEDSEKHSLLHFAATSNTSNSDVIKTLIEAGLDVNSRDSNQQTPLQLALSRYSADTVKALVGFGADVNVLDKVGIISLPLFPRLDCLVVFNHHDLKMVSQHIELCEGSPGLGELQALLLAKPG